MFLKLGGFDKTMTDELVLKMAVIAGASNALKLKEKNPSWNDDKIFQKINDQILEILSKLDRE